MNLKNIQVEPEIELKYSAIWEDLKLYYRSEGHKLPNAQLMIQLDKIFGDRLLDLINKPLKFFNGTGAFLATILLRQSCAVNEELNMKDDA